MKPPTLNQVATWLPMKRDELDIKIFPAYNYVDHISGMIRAASKLEPVIRYAKNYTRGKAKFSLCLITLERDTKLIEQFLDDVSTLVDYDPKDQHAFIRTKYYYIKDIKKNQGNPNA